MVTKSPRKRTFLEIIASILNACQHEIGKTNLISQCKMNSKQFTNYVDMLLKTNLLLIDHGRQNFLFTVSSKGKDFLKAYNSMKTLVELP